MLLTIIVVVAVVVVASWMIFLRKRLQNLSSVVVNENLSPDAVDINVIVNGNQHCQSTETYYEEVCNYYTIEPETKFDTINVT